MEIITRLLNTPWFRLSAVLTACALSLVIAFAPAPIRAENERVITVFHDGIEQTVVSDAASVAEVLERMQISVSKFDSVEPALPTTFTAPSYNINIYRARPVTVVDGASRYQIMSAHTSARKIAEAAGLDTRNEDQYNLERIDNFLTEDGVGLKLTIDRAIPINLVLYGKPSHIYTQAASVEALLKERDVKLAPQDGLNVSKEALLNPEMTIEVWRDGEQTVSEEKSIAFPVEQIRDADQDVGYKQVKTPGKNGKKLVTYAIELRNGQEVARKELQSVITEQAVKQVEVIGVKRGFSGAFQEALAKLRACESGGRYDRNSGNGYYGAYQYNLSTWANYQGYNRPDLAPPEVQDQKVYETYQRRGWQPWPACSKKLGLQDVYR